MVLVDAADHTTAKRRVNARRLAENVSTFVIDDTRTDEKLNNGDKWTLKMIGLTTIDSTHKDWENFIMASDYWAAAEILDEIPGKGTEAERKRDAAREITRKINTNDPSQNIPTFARTSGINNQKGTFG